MSFSEETVEQVWQKATYVDPQCEAQGFRKDQCGAWIQRQAYGDRNSDYGWEIDHITPRGDGGGDEPSNLRPLHWRNNLAKSGGRLTCVVRSNGNKNVMS